MYISVNAQILSFKTYQQGGEEALSSKVMVSSLVNRKYGRGPEKKCLIDRGHDVLLSGRFGLRRMLSGSPSTLMFASIRFVFPE